MASDSDPQGAIHAAEIANGRQDWETTENALLEALSRVRRRKGGGADE